MFPRLPLAPKRHLLAAGVTAYCSLLLAAGCGPNYKARGEVKGQVKAGQKLLTTGTVMFYNSEGMTGSAGIDPDGNYEMKDAPVGECKVTVVVQNVPMDPSVQNRLTGKGKGPKMPGGDMKPPEGVGMAEGVGSDGPAPPLARIPTEVVLIDAKYSKTETSGLKFTVNKGVQHTFNIEMEPGPEPPKMGKSGPMGPGPMGPGPKR